MKAVLGWGAGIVGTVLILAFASAYQHAPEQKPYTFADMHRDRINACIRAGGHGRWRSSLGVSLEQFCDFAAGVEVQNCQRNQAHC